MKGEILSDLLGYAVSPLMKTWIIIFPIFLVSKTNHSVVVLFIKQQY